MRMGKHVTGVVTLLANLYSSSHTALAVTDAKSSPR